MNKRERERERERESKYESKNGCFSKLTFMYPGDILCPVMRTMMMLITIGARAFPQKLGMCVFQIWVYRTDLKVNVYTHIQHNIIFHKN